MRMLTAVALLLLAATSSAVAAEPSFDGNWWGLIDTGATRLHLAFKLRHDKSGWSGDFSSPDQSATWFPLAHVTVDGDTLKLEMSQFHASYEGKRVDKDHVKG